jgi:hypothetical protein
LPDEPDEPADQPKNNVDSPLFVKDPTGTGFDNAAPKPEPVNAQKPSKNLPPGVFIPHEGITAKNSGLCVGIQCDDSIKCATGQIAGTHTKECCPRCSNIDAYCNQFHAAVCEKVANFQIGVNFFKLIGALS